MDGTILGDVSVSLQKILTAAVKGTVSTAAVSLDPPTDAKPASPMRNERLYGGISDVTGPGPAATRQ
jgi:hypothetical protein